MTAASLRKLPSGRAAARGGRLADGLRVELAGPEETRALGERIGRRARGGELLALSGPLGSGKTTFVQGFARGAGFHGNAVSPTFSIAREYRGRLVLHHLDLFRIAPGETANLGLEELLADPRGVCLIEWPEAAAGVLPADRLELSFTHRRRGRSLRLRARGPLSRKLLAAVSPHDPR